ncbi:MAG: DNA-3-methyladenine glycosylase [Saprospiraceae bacterium]|nr:DNA-3-methyladenine glycosylase [Saprospiraceae bacterium]
MRSEAVLSPSFYRSPDVVKIARLLIGSVLHTRIDGVHTAGVIVETEAYRAPEDKACHAYGNKRTPRTETMFEAGGISYVYLCYGIHHLFNVVTGPAGSAHAVLIRAIQPLIGLERMLTRRGHEQLQKNLTTGPGSLTRALGITKELNAVSLQGSDSPIWITQGSAVASERIVASPRVGVDYAAECAQWPWRFRLKDSPWVSPAK